MNGVYYKKNKDNKNSMTFYNQVDILSGIGKKILSGTLKSKMKKYHDNLLIKMTEFLLLKKDYSQLVWFDKVSDIQRIVDENKKILKESSFNKKKLNQEAQVELELLQK